MQDFPFPLVVPLEGEPRASSEVIARGVGIQHKNLLAMIRKYGGDLSEFGRIAFQTRNPARQGGRPTEVAMLNEQQATLLLAFMSNSQKMVLDALGKKDVAEASRCWLLSGACSSADAENSSSRNSPTRNFFRCRRLRCFATHSPLG